jgi:hypothetical protein
VGGRQRDERHADPKRQAGFGCSLQLQAVSNHRENTMSARQALLEGATKAQEAARDQARLYLGANDYWYAQLRRPATLQVVSEKFSKLSDESVERLRELIGAYSPDAIFDVVQDQLDTVRERRRELTERGEAIVQDWRKSVAVQDATAFVSAVRGATNPTELVDSVWDWLEDFTPGEPVGTKPTADAPADAAAKPKSAPRKTATSKAKPR